MVRTSQTFKVKTQGELEAEKELETLQAKRKREEEILRLETPLPPLPPTPISTPETKLPTTETPEVFRDVAGRRSGITINRGGEERTFLGLNSEDVDVIAGREAERLETPAGAQEVGVATEQRRKQAEGLELAQQVGLINPEVLAQIQQTDPDYYQAVQTALTGILPSVTTGVGAGLVTGATAGAVGGPIGAGGGALIGAAVGAIGGFLSGFRSNIAGQTADNIRRSATSLRKVESNLRKLVTLTNLDPSGAVGNLALFNEQLSIAQREWGNLNLNAKEDLALWLGKDGTPELGRFTDFFATGGARDLLVREMQSALANPDPNKNLVVVSDFEELE